MAFFSVIKKLTRVTYTCIFMLFLSACSSVFNQEQTSVNFYTLQAIPENLVDTSVLESLVFKNKETQKLMTQVEFHQQSLHMVAMTYSGLPIIQAKWQHNKGLVELISSHFNHAIVLRIIRDVQWVKWPVAAIQKGLTREYVLTESTVNGYKIREIKLKNNLLVKVTYTPERIMLENIAEQYELVIEQLNGK